MTPKVEYVTDSKTISDRVKALWGGGIEPAAAALIRNKFREFDVRQIADAIERAFEDDPDSRRPNWKAIHAVLKRTRPRNWQPKNDTADSIRAHWRSIEKPEGWMTEVLAFDEAGQATSENLIEWYEAWRLMLDYRHRVYRQGWPAAGDSLKRSRPARVRTLHMFHAALRRCEEVGGATREWLCFWRDAVETDAITGGVELEGAAMETPF